MTQHTIKQLPATVGVRPCPSRRAQRGQTIIVALLTLMLLAFTGALFLSIVTRNLQNAAHGSRLLSTYQYAAAGLKFADDQLTTSPDGADWRPAYAPLSNTKDPDYDLIQNKGFSRYNIGNGRFLIRVTYDPLNLNNGPTTPNNDISRYIKIEAVGRDGTIEDKDPTTFSGKSGSKLNTYLVAYKAIGLTDYARFETNPDNRSDVANIGVPSVYSANAAHYTPGVYDFQSYTSGAPPTITLAQFPVATTLGAPDAYIVSGGKLTPNPNVGSVPPAANTVPGGGSFRSNGPVRFFGVNNVYLNQSILNESMQVAGNILLDNFSTDPTRSLTQQNATLAVNSTLPNVYPSSSPLFDTLGGGVRDGGVGGNLNDAAGYPRAINRLNPPILDNVNPATNRPRYRDLAITSFPRTDRTNATPNTPYNGSGANPSLYGYGKIIYINNPTDTQPDSSAVSGGYTLANDWMNRNGSQNWKGGFYNPPAANIDLGIQPIATSGTTSPYGVAITRSDSSWLGPNGNPLASPTKVINALFDDLDLSGTTGSTRYNDVVIYAEGNIRVHGIVSAVAGIPVHLTIVTNATAYIDGSVLKGNQNSTIAILAHDYVCVNTTQFLAGVHSDAAVEPPDTSVSPPSPVIPVDPTASYADTSTGLHGFEIAATDTTQEILQEFTFGLPNGVTPLAAYGDSTATGVTSGHLNSLPYLYVSASALNTDAETVQPEFSLWNTTSGFTTVRLKSSVVPQFAAGSSPDTMTHLTFALEDGTLKSIENTTEDAVSTVGIKIQQPNATPSDLAVERSVVLPMDVRIEAVLFAQTRSFFVIPGEWFNTDSSDNLEAFITPSTAGTTPHRKNTASNDESRFPFYGQPIDLRIIIDGAVSEARPADISAQSEWMRKWGWIPQYHGSLINTGGTFERAGHRNSVTTDPALGLTIIYDPTAGIPTSGTTYLRFDANNNPLPFTPRLPVCAGLIYTGQTTTETSLFP